MNQIQRAFNGLGQMITEWQSHSGAVNTSTSPKVQYTWSEMPSGANHSRLTGIVYPNGRTVSYDYGSGLNATISRLDALKESSTVLEGYSCLDLGTVVARSHANGVDLTYVKRSGESNGDAGDQYIGLDRFGRIVDQRWVDPSTGTATDRFQYGYDRNGNRLFRDNLVNSAFGELYSYDGLNQLVSFDRGTLNGGRTAISGSPARSQDWDYDALGNFDSVTTNGGSPETRTANAQNEITSISGLTTPTYDANGNMTTDQAGLKYYYDAWNRLVTVKNSAGTTTLTSYQYDGASRRVSENPGTVRDLYYSANWQVLEERVGGAAQVQYVWSPVYVDAQVLRDRDTDANGSLDERLWVQQDANWNVAAIVDGSGAVIERYAYDAYGATTIYTSAYSVRGSSSYAETYLFQGRPTDSVTGNFDNRMRWHSPALGMWTTTDPIQFLGGDTRLNGFMGNNPSNYTDPSGLKVYVNPAEAPIDVVFDDEVYAVMYRLQKDQRSTGMIQSMTVLLKLKELAVKPTLFGIRTSPPKCVDVRVRYITESEDPTKPKPTVVQFVEDVAKRFESKSMNIYFGHGVGEKTFDPAVLDAVRQAMRSIDWRYDGNTVRTEPPPLVTFVSCWATQYNAQVPTGPYGSSVIPGYIGENNKPPSFTSPSLDKVLLAYAAPMLMEVDKRVTDALKNQKPLIINLYFGQHKEVNNENMKIYGAQYRFLKWDFKA